MTQGRLAEMLGINRENISRWENNVAEPSRDNLIKLADIFKVSTDFLLGRVDEPPIHKINGAESGVVE